MKIEETGMSWDRDTQTRTFLYEISGDTVGEDCNLMVAAPSIRKIINNDGMTRIQVRLSISPLHVDVNHIDKATEVKPATAKSVLAEHNPTKKKRNNFTATEEEIRKALKENKYNINKTAKHFGIAWITLSSKMKKYGIEVPEPFRSKRGRRK